MVMTNKEREELKDQGYIYHKSLGKWMTPDEIDSHNKDKELADNLSTIFTAIVAGFCFIYMFTLF